MAGLVVTCAGCGKRYKGSQNFKKFKCAACGNLFSFPDSPRAPAADTTLCSCCWTSYPLSPTVRSCTVCSQSISPQFSGRASEETAGISSGTNRGTGIPVTDEKNRTTTTLMKLTETNSKLPVIGNGNDPARPTGDLERTLADVQTQLSAALEVQAGLIQERDALAAARDAAKARIAELETESGEAQKARGALDVKLAEYQTRLSLWQESQASALKERDEVTQALRGMEGNALELKARLDSAQEARAELVREREKIAADRQRLEEKIVELNTRVELALQAQQSADAACERERESGHTLQNRLAETQTRLQVAEESKSHALSELALAGSEKQALQNRVTELEIRMAMQNDAQAAALAARESEAGRLKAAETKVVELEVRNESARAATAMALAERDSSIELRLELERKSAELREQYEALCKSLEAAATEREAILQAKQSAESKTGELQIRMAEMQKSHEGIESERQQSRSAVERERSKLAEAKLRLQSYKELSASALGPLSREYARVIGELALQSEAIHKIAEQTQNEMERRRENLDGLQQALRGRLNNAYRDFAEQLLQLDMPAEATVILPSLMEEPQSTLPAPVQPSHASQAEVLVTSEMENSAQGNQ